MNSGASGYRYLLDTNIILYPNDPTDAARQRLASELLIRLVAESSAALPAQALAEFANVALRKFRPSMDWSSIYRKVEELKQAFPVLPLTPEVVLEALRGVRDHLFSYYDAQIWAVAKIYEIPVVLSEDFNSGSVIEGIMFLNPFDETFDLTTIV
ncbi:MAG: PIN domain-containing protein [Coleofasciculus sp. S288]|nr:PIN domain-containing protein [Coleofasciculus sp. S288]